MEQPPQAGRQLPRLELRHARHPDNRGHSKPACMKISSLYTAKLDTPCESFPRRAELLGRLAARHETRFGQLVPATGACGRAPPGLKASKGDLAKHAAWSSYSTPGRFRGELTSQPPLYSWPSLCRSLLDPFGSRLSRTNCLEVFTCHRSGPFLPRPIPFGPPQRHEAVAAVPLRYESWSSPPSWPQPHLASPRRGCA